MRTFNMSDVQQGYRGIDPFSSRSVIRSLSLLLIAYIVHFLYINPSVVRVVVFAVHSNTVELGFVVALLFLVRLGFSIRAPRPIYLMNFQTFKPPKHYNFSIERYMELTDRIKSFSEEAKAFQLKLLQRSGMGDTTSFPEFAQHGEEIQQNNGDAKIVCNMQGSKQEAEEIMYSCLDALFAKNDLDPKKDVDILVLNCSMFAPTPSLTSMIVNKYKMKSSIKTYNLSGMGCSAGVISIDLAKDLLQVHRNSNCVVVSMENLTQNWYLGEEKSMLISNTLFRMGGAAIFLTNKASARCDARYQLMHTVRTHHGARDESFCSIAQEVDEKGIYGVKLSKTIMDVAGDALKENMTTLAPLVMPPLVHLQFALHLFQKKVLKQKLKPFVPDFHRAFRHFCIHTGGRAVLDVMEKALNLNEEDLAPSRQTLHRYGNTSTASIWYELEYIEDNGKMHRGDRIWQLAFGSGLKCNSAVWKALQTV